MCENPSWCKCITFQLDAGIQVCLNLQKPEEPIMEHCKTTNQEIIDV